MLSAACGGETSGATAQGGRVTVPDDVSGLPSREVERRLGGLLEPGQPVDGGLAAPAVEPTIAPTPAISIEDILDALNSGQGGVGEVELVQDHDIQRTVAVKRLRPDRTNVEAVARFVQEIRTVGQLEHPNIIPIHDVGLDRIIEQNIGRLQVAMDYAFLVRVVQRVGDRRHDLRDFSSIRRGAGQPIRE